MRIEGSSDINISYQNTQSAPTAPKVAPVETKIQSTNETRMKSIEIKDYMNKNVGYQPTMQEKLIMESIETANQKILGPEKEFEFAIHKETKQIMVKVIDKGTKEILREIPPEKVLDAVAKMCELAGIFMDEKR